MPGSIVAAARTPWALRHGALEGTRPEGLLAAAMAAAIGMADDRPVDRVLVGCDEAVGAQDQNIGRRTVLDLDRPDIPALTVDGHGVTGLALVDLAASLPGRTLVATVDTPTLVPPGAGLVRDYGRPVHEEPEVASIERAIIAAGIDRCALDAVAARLRRPTDHAPSHLAPVVVGSRSVTRDSTDDRSFDPSAPPLMADGLLTAWHQAEYADGAAAVIIDGPNVPATPQARTLSSHALHAGEHDIGARRASVAAATEADLTLVATASAGFAALVGVEVVAGPSDPISPVLAIGTAPTGDGLRLLVDAFHAVDGSVTVVQPGAFGQTATVGLAPSVSG